MVKEKSTAQTVKKGGGGAQTISGTEIKNANDQNTRKDAPSNTTNYRHHITGVDLSCAAAEGRGQRLGGYG